MTLRRHHTAMQALFVAWYNFSRKAWGAEGQHAGDGIQPYGPRMDDQGTDRAGSSLRFRRLRIAFSAFCGLIALLFLVLFVWSYWWLGALVIPLSGNRVVALYAIKGTVGAGTSTAQRRRPLTFDALSADLAIEAWRDVNVTPPSSWFGGIIKIKETDVISVYLPIWIMIGVVVAMSVAPWTRWQFTLRTLLIATTLIAVLFGLMVRTEK